MAKLIQDLDKEVAEWRQLTFAESTKAAYRSHQKTYFRFCQMIGVHPVPASTTTICRYAAYLGRSRAFSTVQQYLNIVRILHIETGLDNPMANNWTVTSLLKGMKRGKGLSPSYKLPIYPADLLRIYSAINLKVAEDSLFWAMITSCFFGLLRVSNVVFKAGTASPILQKDCKFSEKGVILTVRSSKTIQCKERVLEVPLPYVADSSLCPTTAILHLLGRSKPNRDKPLFAYDTINGYQGLTAAQVRQKLSQILARLGYHASDYGTHSLRRGGATWLILSGVPLPLVKAIGDWKSDCVLKYIKPNTNNRFDILRTAIAHNKL